MIFQWLKSFLTWSVGCWFATVFHRKCRKSVHPFTTEHTSKCQLAWLLYQIIEYHHLDNYIRCIDIKSFLTSFIVAFFNLLKE